MEKCSSVPVPLSITLLTASSKVRIRRTADVRDDPNPRQNIDTAPLQADIRHQTLPPCLLRDDGPNGKLVSGIRIRRLLRNYLVISV